MDKVQVLIVGAGVGGMAAAIELARAGRSVRVLDAAPGPGGKMRTVDVQGRPIDAGPTVLTLRHVLDALVPGLALEPLEVLARHGWADGGRLDLYADPERSAAAIEALSGPRDAQGYLDFVEYGRGIWGAVRGPFMERDEPSVLAFAAAGPIAALKVDPFRTMWGSIGRFFKDPRLRQLFGRYATYTGCDPWKAPATLNLVAEVERMGVWTVPGGMAALARALHAEAQKAGASFEFDTPVLEIGPGRVRTAKGEMRCDTVVFNGDVGALEALGAGRAAKAPSAEERSLSALTVCFRAKPEGWPLAHHSVFFSGDYAVEFEELRSGKLPSEPTFYVCAQQGGYLGIINAPPRPELDGLEATEEAAFDLASRCGVDFTERVSVRTGPADFARLFPGSNGAIYGKAGHGWSGALTRPGVRSRIPGIYLCGGSVHPGAGVPMAAQSGRLAARAILEDAQ